MQFWQAIVLGIIEGLTEFIPVSSTGHLIIANAILGLSGDVAASFDVCIQGGAILAVVWLYWDQFRALLKFGKPTNFQLAVAAAIIPFLIAGALFGSTIKRVLFGMEPVAYALVVGGVMLILSKRLIAKRSESAEFISPSLKQALLIGVFQLGALWPGMSRSACTIFGGLVAGLPLSIAAKFSFIIAAPILLAASAHDGLHALSTFKAADLAMLAVGFLVSFIFAFLSLTVFMRLLNRVGLQPFGYYRVIIGIAILFFLNH